MTDAVQYLGLVRRLASISIHGRWRFRIEDTEEYQDGCLGLVKACQTFVEGREACFVTYATICVQREIWQGQRKRCNWGRGWYVARARIHNMEFPEYVPQAREEVGSLDYRDIVARLRERDRRFIIKSVVEGWNYEEIGKQEVPPISRERVRQVIERAFQEVRKALPQCREEVA